MEIKRFGTWSVSYTHLEHAVVREVREETGLEVEHLRFNRAKFFEPSNTLMCNFTAFVRTAKALHINHRCV